MISPSHQHTIINPAAHTPHTLTRNQKTSKTSQAPTIKKRYINTLLRRKYVVLLYMFSFAVRLVGLGVRRSNKINKFSLPALLLFWRLIRFLFILKIFSYNFFSKMFGKKKKNEKLCIQPCKCI